MDKARIAVVGYGVIGRRVADAVRFQDDMEVVGVAGRSASFSLRDAALSGYDVYLTDSPKAGDVASRLVSARGTLAKLLGLADVVLDCTPSHVPQQYLAIYQQFDRLVTIVQGGEQHEFAGTSFNAFANYEEARGKRQIRVISCSSTGITRFAYALDRSFGVRQVFAALARRAADPAKPSKTPHNALTPTLGRSHHAADVNSVLPRLSVFSQSVDCPTTFGHVINFQADLLRAARRAEVLDVLESFPRVVVGSGLRNTAELAEHDQDMGRRRRDRPEIHVWKEGIQVEGTTVYGTISVHMESITIPETVDCVRAALGLAPSKWTSIYETDRAHGIAKPPECYHRET